MRAPVFPIDAARLTPHHRPMLAIDQVLSANADGARVALDVPVDAWYMSADGRWDELAGIELISQAAAAFNGLPSASETPTPAVGYLAEVRRYQVSGTVYAGDALIIDVRKTTTFGSFLIMTGELRRGDEIIASAELTFWQESRPAPVSVTTESSNPERLSHV